MEKRFFTYSFIMLFLFLTAVSGYSTELKILSLGDCRIVVDDETNQLNLWDFTGNPAGLYWDSKQEYTYNRFLSDTLDYNETEDTFLNYSGNLGYYYPFRSEASFITEIGISNSKLSREEEIDLGKGNLLFIGYNLVLRKFLSLGVTARYSVDNQIDFIEGIQITSTTTMWNIGMAFQLTPQIRLGFNIQPGYILYENLIIDDSFKFDLNSDNFGSSINLIASHGDNMVFGLNLKTKFITVNPDTDLDLEMIGEDEEVYTLESSRIFQTKFVHEIRSGKVTYGFSVELEKEGYEERNKLDNYLTYRDNIKFQFGFGLALAPVEFFTLYGEYFSFEIKEDDKLLNQSVNNSGDSVKFGVDFKFFENFTIRGGYITSATETLQTGTRSFGIGYSEGTKTSVDIIYTQTLDTNLGTEEYELFERKFGVASRINF